MHVKRTKRMLRSRERLRANSSFLNSWERPSALATAVATPSLSRSCMSRYSRSTRLFFHRSGAVRTQFIAAGLLLCGRKAVRREGAYIDRRGPALDKVGHDLGRYWGKKDAITKVAGGNEDARNIRWSEDGQIVRGAGAQACPTLGDWSGRERRNVFC